MALLAGRVPARGARTSPAQQPAAVKAFTGVRLIDGTDRAPIDNATIVVRDGRIVAVGPAASVTIPAGAERVSLAGKTVIPGLDQRARPRRQHRRLERRTPPNVRDLRPTPLRRHDRRQPRRRRKRRRFAARDAQRTPSLDPGAHLRRRPGARRRRRRTRRARLVAKIAAMKVDIVKIRVDDNLGTTPKMAPEIYRAVIDEAHKRGLRVAVHLFYLADAKAVLDAGADFIAHSVRDADVDDDVHRAAQGARRLPLPDADARGLDVRLRVDAGVLLRSAVPEVRGRRSGSPRCKEPARQAEDAKRAQPAQRYKVGARASPAGT